ncbi:tetratricopeptide repeat protein [Fusobacterium periodonticum]|uniref:Tetratricopeptide repeat protein n=1 Tax=Fusobacterium periodonticum ATCC 33693 TaxID=546275 RepID=D4CTG1_9FUSO|nr:tetratricopeptide repeat protein [Fusobacterium periodonticum]EFE87390.1 tetratricopeptide repeat protein [Fusobacterium periodonticum ATCC 33693]
MKEELLEKIERLDDLEKYQEIIDLIESLPTEQLNTELIGELGRAYNNAGNYTKGLEILKTIEFEAKDTALWNSGMAYSYFFLEDFINAEKHFLKIYELDSNNEDVCKFLIETYIALAGVEDKNNNHDKAIEYALEAGKYVRNDEDKVNATSFLAWLYNRYRHHAEAEELLRDILNENKSNEWAYSELGYCLSEQGKFEEALENCFKAKDLGRKDAWLFTRIGICYKNMDKKEEALEYYLKALELSEDDIFILSDIAWLYDITDRYEEALKYLERLEELGQDDAWTNTEFGFCLSKLGRYEEAIEKLNHALEIEDENDDKDIAYIYARLGWCKRKLNMYDEAIEDFNQAKKWGRNDAVINTEIGHCYKAKDEYENALKYYLQAEKFDKKDPYITSEIAWHYGALGLYDESIKYVKKTIRLGRNDAWINVEYGACLAGLDKYEEAIEKFEYALSLDEKEEEKDLAFVHSQLGWCYRHLGNCEKALEYLMLSKEEGRNDAWINVEIAICYENLEDYEKALEYALVAHNLDKDDVLAISEVGAIYNSLEKYEEALPFLLRAEELGREDEWINTEIALNLGRSGKVNEALERLEKSLTLVDEADINQRIFINSEIAWNYGRLEEPQPEEALKYLNIAKELGREDAWLYSQIGYQLGCNFETRKEALEHFEKAMELGREDAWIFEMMGSVLVTFERNEEALDYFKKAYAKDEDGWYLYSMGSCLRKLGRYEEAIEILLESRQISIDEEDVVDGEDLELAHSYLGLGDKDNAQKYLDLARDSILEQGTLNDDIKAEIEEIEKGILSLNN